MKGEAIRRCLLVAAAAAMLSTGARAQTVDIPYQGWLTQGDQPCNGDDYEMVFKLYNSPTSTNVVWSNTYNQVNVSNGAFSVVLPVPEGHVIANEALYLEITVQQEQLVNRQRIYPAMYAARGEMGVDEFWVKDASSTAGLAITSGLRGHTETRADVSEISNDTGGEMALVIAGNRSAGGSRRVKIYDELTVNGPLNVEGRTFRGMRLEPQEWVLNGEATPGVPYDSVVDTAIPLSDGMCFLTTELDLFYTIHASSASAALSSCRIRADGTPQTWYLQASADCAGAECHSVEILCAARCVRWNW